MTSTPAASPPDPAGLIWLDSILSPVIEVSVFGGSILFSVVVGSQDHVGAQRLRKHLPTFFVLAWFFFVLALGLAIATGMVLSFRRDHIKIAFAGLGLDKNQAKEPWYSLDRSAQVIIVRLKIADVLCLLILLAFFFRSLCVAAHNVAIGSLAAGCTGLTTLLFGFTWLVQNVGRWKSG